MRNGLFRARNCRGIKEDRAKPLPRVFVLKEEAAAISPAG